MIAEDGSITLDLGDNSVSSAEDDFPQYILGTWDKCEYLELDNWSGNGDYSQVLSPVEIVKVPEGLEMSEWSLAPIDQEWYYDFGIPHKVYMGFDGNDVYVKGICDLDENSVMKGEIKNGILTFPAIQTIGWEKNNNAILFTHNTLLEVKDGEYVATDDTELTFELDMENNTFKPNKEEILWITGHPTEFQYFQYFVNPKIIENTMANLCTDLMAPIYLTGGDFTPTMGYLLNWAIPNINNNGCVLDKGNMYYNFYINDELFTWEKSVYFNIPEDMSDVPMTYDDKGLFIFQTTFIIPYYGFWLMYENYPVYSLGIQTFYNAPDGNTYESPLNMIDPGFYESALPSTIFENTDAINEIYYNLSGIQVLNPSNGLFIKVTTYSDGTHKAEKVKL